MEDQLRHQKLIREQGFEKVLNEWIYDRTTRRYVKKEGIKEVNGMIVDFTKK